MTYETRIKVLVEDTASSSHLLAEHGLSFWIEFGDSRVLFDTGKSDVLRKNASSLNIDLAKTTAIVLSHGHYDHTGGVEAALEIASNARIYLHPASFVPKFTRGDGGVRAIGMPDSIEQLIHTKADKGKVILTVKPTEVAKGLLVTGQIPRITDFEIYDGSFFVDRSCRRIDTFPDDQAIFIDSPRGLVVLLGCAHAGVVNTLHYVGKLTGQRQIYAVLGGMHLLNATSERINQTIDAFRQYNVQRIGLAHCTGRVAVETFRQSFPDKCFLCPSGTQIELGIS
jgi:7,8-dihydropterin-6-yl-methyl-4-(beta-D-ribofuranosyl)aminobenzene 5'-phosphate synthase